MLFTSVGQPCTALQFQCVDDGSCINIELRCDYGKECGDLSDEEGCE